MHMLDLTGSTILAAVVIAAILGLNLLLADTTREMKTELSVQETMVEFSRTMEYMFTKIGQGDTLSTPVLEAKKNRITFIGDIRDKNISDTVIFAIGDTAMLKSTPNPKDFPLFQIVKRKSVTPVKPDTLRMNIGLTLFEMTYLDSLGATTTDPKKVKGLRIKARAENPLASTTQQPTGSGMTDTGAEWETVIFPRNLNVPK